MPSQKILQKKINEVKEIATIVEKYNVIGIASLQKVRGNQLQEFRRKLEKKAYIKVLKNTILRKAIEKCDKSKLNNLLEHLTGANVFLFTDLSPFELALILEKGKIITTAKSGDIAAFDVVVPEGNTGQPPGPVISQLNAVGLPTRIESGSVWVSKDTLVIKRGETIAESLASILSKLGIKSVEAGLAIKIAYENGLIIDKEQLHIDLDEVKGNITKAYKNALALSLDIAYITEENVKTILQIAHKDAKILAIETTILTKENIDDLIKKAYGEAKILTKYIAN